MPAQVERLEPQGYRLRHIGPAAALYPSGNAPAATTVFGQSLTFRELPISRVPSSHDFADGTWTLRLSDAGEWQITFPNADASDGLPWRSRFDTTGHKQFLEVYRGDDLEFVGVILKSVADRKKVVVSGQDGAFLLRKAYERDSGALVMAPRDWVERYSRLYVPLLADDFTGNALAAGWTTFGSAGVAVANGIATVTAPTLNVDSGIQTKNLTVNSGDEWSVTARLTNASPQTGTAKARVDVMSGAGVNFCSLEFQFDGGPSCTFYAGNTTPVAKPISYPAVLTIEGVAGRWVRGYVNGQLIGFFGLTTLPALVPQNIRLTTHNNSNNNATASWDFIVFRKSSGLLLAGASKGDYVLPGAASAYPQGGLHGRYYNDGDLSGLAAGAPGQYLQTTLAPGRKSYFDRQDGPLAGAANPTPGAATAYWSCRFFGAIYLQLSKGNYTMQLAAVAGAMPGFRLWVGKTQATDTLIMQGWSLANGSGPFTGTVNAAALGSKDGWYPIVLEWVVGATTQGIPTLNFSALPGGAADPNGVALSTGLIPATCFSPLGCVDQRAQGQSHFDLFQKGCADYGYQFGVTPQQLESTTFPAIAVPLARVGRDTEMVLEPDDSDKAEALLNYASTLDATDEVSSLRGNGAGVQDGSTGQLQSEAISFTDMLNDLYDLQGWQDSTDVAFPSLLVQKLGTLLGLRTAPWQNVTGDPVAKDRLADTFPLTGALAKAKLLPGDGLRLRLPDVGVFDVNPRQILQLTRTFGALGRTGAQAGFRQRPRDPLLTIRDLLYGAMRPNRTKQGQYVNLQTPFTTDTIFSGGTGVTQQLALQPSDQVVYSEIRIMRNTLSMPLALLVNGVDRAPVLCGADPISAPTVVPLGQYAVAGSGNSVTFNLGNAGGSTTVVDWQVFVVVLR